MRTRRNRRVARNNTKALTLPLARVWQDRRGKPRFGGSHLPPRDTSGVRYGAPSPSSAGVVAPGIGPIMVRMKPPIVSPSRNGGQLRFRIRQLEYELSEARGRIYQAEE